MVFTTKNIFLVSKLKQAKAGSCLCLGTLLELVIPLGILVALVLLFLPLQDIRLRMVIRVNTIILENILVIV